MADIVLDYSELKGKIRAVYSTQEAFADAMGIGRTGINQRLQGTVEWRSPEIVQACELLGIPLEQAHIYFFAQK